MAPSSAAAARPAAGAAAAAADGAAAKPAFQPPAPNRGSAVPIYFKELDEELLHNEIQFKDDKERDAYVASMEGAQAANSLTSDNIVVDFGWDPATKNWKRPNDDGGWAAVSMHQARKLPTIERESTPVTEDSSDFESVGSDAESDRLPQQSPPRTAITKTTAASPKYAIPTGGDNVDHKYAGIVAKIGLRPEHATLHAMSLDELRFLLRKNGTSSHNMLKTPVVRTCLPDSISNLRKSIMRLSRAKF